MRVHTHPSMSCCWKTCPPKLKKSVRPPPFGEVSWQKAETTAEWQFLSQEFFVNFFGETLHRRCLLFCTKIWILWVSSVGKLILLSWGGIWNCQVCYAISEVWNQNQRFFWGGEIEQKTNHHTGKARNRKSMPGQHLDFDNKRPPSRRRLSL